ncbi:MAG: CheR family methyltransferase [Chloroflexia bacterium]
MANDKEADGASTKGKLVVIGSSAGGIDALSVLVSTLRPDFPAPIVLAQHLDPRKISHLESILSRRSALPVVLVEDKTPIESGKIYVVPSNRHVLIADGHVELDGDHETRPRPSVDLLLSSAALAYGEDLIAVILTGSGSDGAAGAVEVHKAGGTVIIQNPQTALYSSMPLALPPTVVDHVADLADIGPLLYAITQGTGLSQAVKPTEDPLREILSYVSSRSNVDFSHYKPTTILRRLTRRMTATHNRSLSRYQQHLEQNPEEVGTLVKAFLIKVTEFFRDPEAFEYLKSTILPEIIERGRHEDRTLRFWSAGCATGEEPYSLAILLADLLGEETPQWNIKIFATDLDENAISFARRGLYPENVLRNLPDDYRARFFERADKGFCVAKVPRQMVIFGQQDLSRVVPFPRIDMVVCRNLLIYFKPELQQGVLDMFAYSLHRTNGFLFLGPAETVTPARDSFQMVGKPWRIYRCVSGPSLFNPLLSSAERAEGPHRNRRSAGRLAAPAAPDAMGEDTDLARLRRLNEGILRFLPAGVLVIDRAYHILTLNAAARQLLNIREFVNAPDFLHTVRGLPYAEVRAAIDTVFRERTTVTLPEIEIETNTGEHHYVTLTILPLNSDVDTPDRAVVSAVDATESVQIRRRLETAQSEQKQLLDELSAANRRLNELNNEAQTANEELRDTNEEMMLMQEELQATNEEFEATNEELQATNEELETNNEELQATNEELETTNEELTARSNELQDLARSLTRERMRLAEMVELAPLYSLLLSGPSLLIRDFSPGYERIFPVGHDVLNLPLAQVLDDPQMADLVHTAEEAYGQNSRRVCERQATILKNNGGPATETNFTYTILPTHDSDGQVDGVIIYAEDVSRQMAQEAEVWREQLKLMVEHADQVAIALYDSTTAQLLQASTRYLESLERAYDCPRSELVGRRWHEFPFFAPREEANGCWKQAVERRTTCRTHDVRLHPESGEAGSTGIWNCTLTAISADTDGGKQPVRFVVVSAIEVTDQVKIREELQRIDRLKDDFLAYASHELRSPLVPLRGYADLLMRRIAHKQGEPGWDQHISDYAAKFDAQIRYLSRLVDDLFDITRMQNDKLTLEQKPVDLLPLLERAVEQAQMISPEQSFEIHVPRTRRPLRVVGDASRLMQVVINLLENSAKHAGGSRRVDLYLRRIPARKTAAGVAAEAEIAVQDYGPGIAKHDLNQLFTRFYQAKQENRSARGGLGLGLYIAKQIIEQHGGTIGVASEVGKGSTFTIRVPLEAEP